MPFGVAPFSKVPTGVGRRSPSSEVLATDSRERIPHGNPRALADEARKTHSPTVGSRIDRSRAKSRASSKLAKAGQARCSSVAATPSGSSDSPVQWDQSARETS